MQPHKISHIGFGCSQTNTGVHQVAEGAAACRMCGEHPWAETFAADIRAVVADKGWQALRVSFLGRWKGEGEKCLAELRAYLDDLADPARVRRGLNYLTGSGFRSGAINPPGRARLLTELREARDAGLLRERCS
jgi:hypothetical protein